MSPATSFVDNVRHRDDPVYGRVATGYGGLFYGVYPALVRDLKDPDQQGRVKVSLPWAVDARNGGGYEAWARMATFAAGADRGSWWIPDVGDEVLVAFEAGDARHPFVVGVLWNGQDAPPESMDGGGQNHFKSFTSRNGVRILLDDTSGTERLVLETPAGQSVILKDGENAIELADANGNTVKLDSSGITITASAKVTINASNVEVSAGMVSVNAGMSKFSGVVKCDTMISNAVVSASYTPGAGNVW